METTGLPPSEVILEACTKCKKNLRADSNPTNKWCLECRAEYQRNYQAGLKKQTAEQAFARGVTAMRKRIVNAFGRIGASQCTGFDAAAWVMTEPAPNFDDEETTRPRL